MTLGEALADEIERRGISQRQAAEMMGVRQQGLSKWIAGDYRPGPDFLPAIAKFLRQPLNEVKAMRSARRPDRDRLTAIESRLTRLEEFLVERATRRRR